MKKILILLLFAATFAGAQNINIPSFDTATIEPKAVLTTAGKTTPPVYVYSRDAKLNEETRRQHILSMDADGAVLTTRSATAEPRVPPRGSAPRGGRRPVVWASERSFAAQLPLAPRADPLGPRGDPAGLAWRLGDRLGAARLS